VIKSEAASDPRMMTLVWPVTSLVGADVHDDAFRDAVTRLASDVWRVLRRCGVGQSDIDDAAQLVFIQMNRRWSQLSTFEERALRAYVLCMATGTAREMGRGRSRRFRKEDAATREPSPSAVATPEEMMARKESCAIVDQILSTMDAERREVFVLYEIEELSGREIAEHLGIPAGTVASRLRAAREQFEQMVAKLPEGGPR
jgi:RNA polymerase sigma-70 factor (ECF subfamily)